MIGQSMINVRNGGTGRLAGVCAGLLTLVITLVVHGAIGKVPVASLVGVMWCVSYHTFERDTFGLVYEAFTGNPWRPESGKNFPQDGDGEKAVPYSPGSKEHAAGTEKPHMAHTAHVNKSGVLDSVPDSHVEVVGVKASGADHVPASPASGGDTKVSPKLSKDSSRAEQNPANGETAAANGETANVEGQHQAEEPGGDDTGVVPAPPSAAQPSPSEGRSPSKTSESRTFFKCNSIFHST